MNYIEKKFLKKIKLNDKFFFNSRFLLVFVTPFFLGCISVFSFQPFNFLIVNFFIFPLLFFILCNINKRSKNKYRKKPI